MRTQVGRRATSDKCQEQKWRFVLRNPLAKEETSAFSEVISGAGDAVGKDLITNLALSGGNVTGRLLGRTVI